MGSSSFLDSLLISRWDLLPDVGVFGPSSWAGFLSRNDSWLDRSGALVRIILVTGLLLLAVRDLGKETNLFDQ